MPHIDTILSTHSETAHNHSRLIWRPHTPFSRNDRDSWTSRNWEKRGRVDEEDQTIDEKDGKDKLKKNAFGSVPAYNPASSSAFIRPIPNIPFQYVESLLLIADVG